MAKKPAACAWYELGHYLTRCAASEGRGLKVGKEQGVGGVNDDLTGPRKVLNCRRDAGQWNGKGHNRAACRFSRLAGRHSWAKSGHH
jgi:hypothetical protein